jgi:hypothetical protein
MVLTLDGMDPDYLRSLTDFHLPEHLHDEVTCWAYVDMTGARMRFSNELLEAMIQLRLSLNGGPTVRPDDWSIDMA